MGGDKCSPKNQCIADDTIGLRATSCRQTTVPHKVGEVGTYCIVQTGASSPAELEYEVSAKPNT